MIQYAVTKTALYRNTKVKYMRQIMAYTEETRPDTPRTWKLLETVEMISIRVVGNTPRVRIRSDEIRSNCSVEKNKRMLLKRKKTVE